MVIGINEVFKMVRRARRLKGEAPMSNHPLTIRFGRKGTPVAGTYECDARDVCLLSLDLDENGTLVGLDIF